MIKNDDKLKLKSDGLKLISNTPIYNDERYGSYAEIIDEKVKEAGVYNIGIIAPYGAGKSSLIKTYKEKYGVKKSVTISLANFSSVNQGEEKSKNANNNVKDIERGQVEKSILEQLLFSVRKCDVPESKINRINPFRTFEGFVTAFSLVACLVFICLSVLDLKNILPHSTEKLFYCFFALSAFFLIIFIFFAFKFYSVKRIAIKDIETEFGSNQESILNKFIDEIIYYFFSTKTTVVFIEDLDRFDDTNIFAKLREINFLVNNSSVVKEKVTFIYAIKDDIFQTETERAKFFDFVISLLPLVNPINAKDKLNELVNFKDSQIRLPEDYISDISYFISEMRVLKNIVNDYIAKNESSYECRIDKPEIVIKQIKETLFSDRYILNYDIVSNLLSATKSQLLPKKERLIEYLCSGDDRSLDFVIKYVNESNKDIKFFCENVIIKSPMLFKSIIESSVIPSDKKIDVLLYLMGQLTDVDLPRFNENSCITNYLNGLDNPVQEFSRVDIQTFERVLRVFSVKLKNIVVESDYYKLAEKAIEYNAYQVSLSNVSFILFNILKFDRIQYGKKILTAIMNIADDNKKRYILLNGVRFINEIIKNADEICDSEETIKYLLTRNDVDSDTKKAYIHKLTVRFDVCAEINNELCLEAIKSDKIKYSWSNASFCIDNLKIEIAELCDYFVSGAEELSEQECRDENLILNLCNEIGCPTTIKKLAKSFMVNFAVNQINDDDVAVVLIEEGIIEPNSDNLEICCDSERINPACAILCEHKELLPELNRYSLKNDFIDKIVTSKYGDTLIVDLISSLNNYKPESVEAKQKIKEAILKNNIRNVNCELIDYLIESEISEDDKYKLVHLQAAGSSYSKCMQWFKEIDENNSAFEMEEGGSLKKKKEDISGSKVLRILSENGFCKVEEMVRYIKIKRIK